MSASTLGQATRAQLLTENGGCAAVTPRRNLQRTDLAAKDPAFLDHVRNST